MSHYLNSAALLFVLVYPVTLHAIADKVFCHTLLKNEDAERRFFVMYALLFFYLKLNQNILLQKNVGNHIQDLFDCILSFKD